MAKVVTVEGDANPWLLTGGVLQRVSPDTGKFWRFVGTPAGPQISRQVLKFYPCPAGDLGPFTADDFDKVAQ